MRRDARPDIPRKWRWHPRIDGKRVRDMPVYKKWVGMMTRCYNKNEKTYSYYGGRGITVCDRWRLFQNFLSDMGHPPPGFTLDRIDNDRGYSPDNCRWVPGAEQKRNRRSVRTFEIGGRRMCLPEIAALYGINYATLYRRVAVRKEPIERAITNGGRWPWT